MFKQLDVKAVSWVNIQCKQGKKLDQFSVQLNSHHRRASPTQDRTQRPLPLWERQEVQEMLRCRGVAALNLPRFAEAATRRWDCIGLAHQLPVYFVPIKVLARHLKWRDNCIAPYKSLYVARLLISRHITKTMPKRDRKSTRLNSSH